jgi:predicted membrane protein
VLTYGGQFHYASYGLFGENATSIHLKGLNVQIKLIFYALCMIGCLLSVVTLFLVWRNFQIYVTLDDICSFPSTLAVYMGNTAIFLSSIQIFSYLYIYIYIKKKKEKKEKKKKKKHVENEKVINTRLTPPSRQ